MTRSAGNRQGKYAFHGIHKPTYTNIPDDYFDEVMANVSAAEFKVLMYIARRTFGFRKDSDNISLKQMCEGIVKRDGSRLDYGTGLSKQTVVTALDGLIDKGIIWREHVTSDEHGHEKSIYHVVFESDEETDRPLSNSQTSLSSGSVKASLGIGQALVQKLDTQETVPQETENKIDGAILWNRIKADLQASLGGDNYRACIEPCTAFEPQPGRLIIFAPTDDARQWLEAKFRGRLEKSARQCAGTAVVIEIAT